jgi:hypothetical protein
MTNKLPPDAPNTPEQKHLTLVHSQGYEGTPPPHILEDEDAYATLLIDSLHEHIQDVHVREFLAQALSEPDIRKVLASSVPGAGSNRPLLVRVLLPVAKDAQRRALICTPEADAVFVASILHAVDYCFLPVMRARLSAPDAVRTILRDPLRSLERAAPESAEVLRSCMGWGNFDEEGLFVEWLEERMHMALDVLYLSSF